MKNINKNIDQLFQDNLKDLEVLPNPKVWSGIESKLKKKKRRVIPIWWFASGIAASFILAILLFPISENQPYEKIRINEPIITKTPEEKDSNKQFIDSNHDTIILITKSIDSTKSILRKEKTSRKNSSILIAKNNNNATNITTHKLKHEEKSPIEKEKLVDKKNAMEKILLTNTIIDTIQTPTIKNKKNNPKKLKKKDIAYLHKKDSTIVRKEQKKWSFSPVFAIVNTNSFSNSSPIIGSGLQSSKALGENSYSYGIKVEYKLNSKWTLQSGIHLQKLNYSTKNISIASSSSISINDVFNIDYTDNFNLLSSGGATFSSDFAKGSSINQTYGYLEIPIEATYSFIQIKNFNSRFIVGFSSLFLNENKVERISSETFSTALGKANNINNVNFSSNFGVDFDYSLTKDLKLNLNPMLKIQFNTFFKNSNGFKPYFIGVYTGIKYQF